MNVALKTMFAKLHKEKAAESFGNLLSVANESALIRDIMLEEMDAELGIDLNDPNAEEKFKDEMIDEEEMEKLIDNLPETDIDEVVVAGNPANEEEYIGAPLEAMMELIDSHIPETIEE